MNISQIVLTVVLVSAGIFAYDAVRSPDLQDPDDDGAIPWAHDTDTEVPGAEDPSPAVLEGTGDDRWRADVERRLAEVEQVMGKRGRVTVLADEALRGRPDSGTDDEGVSPAAVGIDEQTEDAARRRQDEDGSEPGVARIEPAELKDFRRKLEVVERQRRRERTVRDMNRLLQRLGVTLTDDQRKDVLRATLSFQGKFRALFRRPPTDDQARQERLEAARVLREEYQRTVYDSAPAAEAEKIVEALGRYTNRSRRGSGGGRSRGPTRRRNGQR